MDKKPIHYHLDREKLKQNCDKFSRIGQIYYPLKTNSNPIIINELIKDFKGTNNGFLITHMSHFYELLSLGVDPRRMCSVNVISDENTTNFFYDNGVRYFTFDNFDSLSKFLLYVCPQGFNFPEDIQIAVRLSINEAFNQPSQLGGNVEECKKMLNILKKYGARNVGLSFYLQKEIIKNNEDPLDTMLDFIISNFGKDYELDFINLGGAIRPEVLLGKMDKINDAKEKLRASNIIVEPGRYLVGNAGYIETTIIKKKPDDTFIIDLGIYAGLLDAVLYHKKYDIFLRIGEYHIKLYYEPFDGSKEIKICGSSSDSGDRIGTLYIDERYYDYLKVGSVFDIANGLAYTEEFVMPLGGDEKTGYHVR